MNLDWFDYGVISFIACCCSWINAIAGGGILLLYPLLTFYGLPPLITNVSIKLGLFPGSVGAMYAQRNLLRDQTGNIKLTIPAAFIGAILGSWIVTEAGEKSFTFIVPFCIIFASLIMGFNVQIKKWLAKKSFKEKKHPLALCIGTSLSGMYSVISELATALSILDFCPSSTPGTLKISMH